MQNELPLTSPLLTDRYLLTMCYSWFKAGKHLENSVFEIFFRKNAFEAQFTVLCGINETIDWIRKAKFSESEVLFVQENLSLTATDPFIEWLRNVDFSKISVHAIREGTVVFPYLPVIILEGPLGVVQLTETLILNKLNFPSLIATNARLLKQVIGKSNLFEFGLRRAQGPDGGTVGALYAYVGGAQATSNMLAGYRYGIPVIGTMAHSYITSFSGLAELDNHHRSEDNKKFVSEVLAVRKELGFEKTNDGELAAFISFALDFPNNFICLIDTYDTLASGTLNYAVVAVAMERRGLLPKGIRLDSGDLAKLSIQVKKIFADISAKTDCKLQEYSQVVASDDLSIKKIKAMNGEHSIDYFAVGTKLITCYEQAALGMVCKLCSLDDDPRIKFSETIEKSTLPGRKQVIRATVEKDGVQKKIDIICQREEKDLGASPTVYIIHKYNDPIMLHLVEQHPLLLSINEHQEVFKFDPKASKEQVERSFAEYKPQLDSKEEIHVYISSKLRDSLLALRAKLAKGC